MSRYCPIASQEWANNDEIHQINMIEVLLEGWSEDEASAPLLRPYDSRKETRDLNIIPRKSRTTAPLLILIPIGFY